jgi:hypothetical protein
LSLKVSKDRIWLGFRTGQARIVDGGASRSSTSNEQIVPPSNSDSASPAHYIIHHHQLGLGSPQSKDQQEFPGCDVSC